MGCFEEGLTRAEVITLGCKVNQADSREIAGALRELGYGVAPRWERPELVVVNTCAVTAVSESKGRKEIGRALRRGARTLVVTGCMAEVSGPRTSAIPGVDLVVGREDRHRLPELLLAACPPRGHRGGGAGNGSGTERAKAFIKVQDGCGRRCAFCIVPLARGKPVSLSVAEVMGKVGEALEGGARELVLCGINLGGWRGGDGWGLAGLLEAVLAAGDGFRVRLSSLEPEDVEKGALDGLAGEGRLCPHFHLPLQSGSDEVLRRMGRGYRAEGYLEILEELRGAWDDPAVTTDVMVGFPGETEEDFAKTLAALEKASPARTHVFRYSRRPGTEAAAMQGQVPEPEKRRRAAEVRRRGEEWSHRYAQRQSGKELEMLVEKVAVDGEGRLALGTTGNYLRAELRGGGAGAGELLRGVVTGTDGPRVRMAR